MRKTARLFVRFAEAMSVWSGHVLAGLIFAMIAFILIEVVMRYFFNKPTNWAMELTTMVFGTYMIGGGAWTLYKKGHVKMDIFYNRWSARTKAVMDSVTFPLFFIFLMVILCKSASYGLESLASREYSSTAWGPPLYHWKLSIPLVVFLFACQGLADFVRNLFLAVTGREL
jgi:TRAP-type mannitol/chloroaromatic compound transport system permease small subunit